MSWAAPPGVGTGKLPEMGQDITHRGEKNNLRRTLVDVKLFYVHFTSGSGYAHENFGATGSLDPRAAGLSCRVPLVVSSRLA